MRCSTVVALTLLLIPPSSSARSDSSVFIVRPPPRLRVTCTFLTQLIKTLLVLRKRSRICALTSLVVAICKGRACQFPFERAERGHSPPSLSIRTPGSWMNAPPLELGGMSPVVAYLRHSMMVCSCRKYQHTVFVLCSIRPPSPHRPASQPALGIHTVLPLPLAPCMTVSGVRKRTTATPFSSKERTPRKAMPGGCWGAGVQGADQSFFVLCSQALALLCASLAAGAFFPPLTI